MVLNQADNIMIANQEVQKVFLGTELIWERNKKQYDESKIAVIRLDENMQKTSDIHYTDTVNEAKTFINANSGNMYHVHVGERSQAVPTLNGNLSEVVNLYSIDIPDGVTSLPVKMFYRCSGLTNANLPDSIEEFEVDRNNRAGTFSVCSSLTNIRLPQNLKKIPSGAFSGSGLTSIVIPDSVVEIENATFDATDLQSVSFGTGLKYIGIDDNAFYGAFEFCDALTEIYIPANVKKIGREFSGGESDNGVFSYCENLTKVVIASGVEEIGNETFSFCSNLSQLEIQDGLKKIWSGVFSYCESLTQVFLPDSITELGNNYTGELYNTAGAVFSNCTSLQNIHLPAHLHEIYGSTFAACESLKTIELPEEIELIGDGAFIGCTSLKRINIPDSVRYIMNDAFAQCSSLSEISLPDELKILGIGGDGGVFAGCTSLTGITIPTNVKSLRSGTFTNCTELESISVLNSYRSIGNDPWSAPNFISTAQKENLDKQGKPIPEGKHVVDWNGAGGGDEEKLAAMALLKEIDSSGLVVSYSISKSFSGIRSILTENSDKTFVVDIGGAFNVDKIFDSTVVPSDCFAGLTNVKHISIPRRFNTIEAGAFSGCTGLEYIEIEKTRGAISGEPWGVPDGTIIYYAAQLVTEDNKLLDSLTVRTTGDNSEFNTGLSGILRTETEPEEPVEKMLYVLNENHTFSLKLGTKEMSL